MKELIKPLIAISVIGIVSYFAIPNTLLSVFVANAGYSVVGYRFYKSHKTGV